MDPSTASCTRLVVLHADTHVLFSALPRDLWGWCGGRGGRDQIAPRALELHCKSPFPSPHLAGREGDREEEGGERDRRKKERKGEREMGGWTGGLRGGRDGGEERKGER